MKRVLVTTEIKETIKAGDKAAGKLVAEIRGLVA